MYNVYVCISKQELKNCTLVHFQKNNLKVLLSVTHTYSSNITSNGNVTVHTLISALCAQLKIASILFNF